MIRIVRSNMIEFTWTTPITNMDTRTGLIHEIPPGKTLEDLRESLNAAGNDIIALSNPPDATCPICKGTGRLKRGLFSKRWKPCKCCA